MLGFVVWVSLAAAPLTTVSSTGTHSAVRSFATVARSSTGYVAAWEDEREGPEWARGYLARFDVNGAPLDLQGLPISDWPGFQSDPAVRCIGAACLVAWQAGHEGLHLRTFDVGTAAWGPVVSVETNSNAAFAQPALIDDGVRFFVAWTDTNGAVVVARVTTAGVVSTPVTALSGGYFSGAALAFDAGVLVVTASEGNAPCQVRRQLLNSTTLALVGAQATLGGTNTCFGGGSAVGALGSGFLEAWTENLTNAVRARRITTAGAVLDTPALTLSTGGSNTSVSVSDGVVAWLENGNLVRAVVVPASGAPPASTVLLPIVAGRAFHGLHLARLTADRVLAFGWLAPERLFGTAFDVDAGTLSAPSEHPFLQRIEEVQTDPRLVRLDDGRAVLSYGVLADGGSAAMQVLDALGQPVGGPVVMSRRTEGFLGAAVARVGPDVLQASSHGTLVEVHTVGGTAPTELVFGGYAWTSAPRLAALPSGQALMVWLGQGTVKALFGVVLTDAGVTGPTPLVVDAQLAGEPALGASRTQYLAAWWNQSALLATFPAQPGTPLTLDTTSPIAHPAIASDGTDFLVVWSSGADGTVLARRVSAAGTLPDPMPLKLSLGAVTFVSTTQPSHPEVAFDGTDYVVTWSEVATADAGLDVFLRRVSPTGTLGPLVRRVARTNDQLAPSLVASANGEVMLAWLEATSGGSARVWGELIPGDGGIVFDAGVDAGVDGGLDSGVDSGVDSGTDASVDSGLDDAGSAVSDGGALDPVGDGGGDDGGAPARRVAQVGCACGALDGPLGLLVVALCVMRRRRR